MNDLQLPAEYDILRLVPSKSNQLRRRQAKSMKTLQAQVPDMLLEQVEELAANQNTSIDQIVSLALAAQVSAWRTRESIASRANRVDWQKVDEILARVPDVPPQADDENE